MRIGLFPGSVPGQLKSLEEVIDQVVRAETMGSTAIGLLIFRGGDSMR